MIGTSTKTVNKRDAQYAVKKLRAIKARENDKKALTQIVMRWISENPSESSDGKHFTIDGANVTYTEATVSEVVDMDAVKAFYAAQGKALPMKKQNRSASIRV